MILKKRGNCFNAIKRKNSLRLWAILMRITFTSN